MIWILTKLVASAALIVLISELAKRSERLGALVTALPWIALLALIWMQVEGQPPDKIASYARYTFWYVLPTLPMFFAFPWLQGQFGFWGALVSGIAIIALCILGLAAILRRHGIELI